MNVLLLYLEPQALHVARASQPRSNASATSMRSIALNARDPRLARDEFLPQLRAILAELSGRDATRTGGASENLSGVLLIDSALLEMAEVKLPPVPEREQRALFRRDADRHVPIEGPVAVTLHSANPPLVFACSASWLTQWMQLLGEVLPLRAALAASVALALTRGAPDRQATAPGSSPTESAPTALSRLATSAYDWRNVPAAAHLTDEQTEKRLHAVAQRQRAQTIGMAVAALGILLWLGNTWRERRLATLEQEAAALLRAAEPAESARARLARAEAELSLLADDSRRAAHGASAVLARVGERLPSDAFVQRAEWDGAAWRLDGSAIDAAALVPRLESDSLLRNVRSLAPSTRFLDGGRPRNSFSIGFALPSAEERP